MIIAVDLDGSLVQTDTLYESILIGLKKNPLLLFWMCFWVLRGKAYFKHRLAEHGVPNPAQLPYHQELIQWLNSQRAQGSRIFLISAAHQRIVDLVSNHLPIFEQAWGTHPHSNLSGKHKREFLNRQFGANAYAYVGNDFVDLEVWQASSHAVVVSNSAKLKRRVAALGQPMTEFAAYQKGLRAWLSALRIHQWLKNVLVWVPLIAAHQFEDSNKFLQVFGAMVAFGFTASALYVMNDLLDLGSDRLHPRKCNRPFACGALPIQKGMLVWPVLLGLGWALAFQLSSAFFAVLVLYSALTTAYSIRVKQWALVDCLVLAGLYTLRIIGGGAVIGLTVSYWLLSFSVFFFLSLAFVKRYTETLAMKDPTDALHGRGYRVSDAPVIQTLGIAAGYASIIVLSLYIDSDTSTLLYASREWIWGAILLVLYWLSWIWLQATRGQMNDDPIVFAVRDRTSQGVLVMVALCFWLATQHTGL